MFWRKCKTPPHELRLHLVRRLLIPADPSTIRPVSVETSFQGQRSHMLDDAIERVLIDADTIAAKVKHMAAQISATYQGVDELIMVCILNGAFRFTADLEEHLTIPYNIDFMSLSSYPSTSTTATGEVRVLLDVKNSLHSKHVLIVEDIIDTGHTLNYLYQMLGTKHPATLRSCALVSKTEVREVDVRVDWIGFHVPNEWLVGYGLDWHNKYRMLPYVGVLKPSVYMKK
jgi:hypoxanthine phosphoribosyltransferase